MLIAYPGSRYRRGVSMCRSTRGRAGTMTVPVPVATSTRRRTRPGRHSANCCASPPPHEMPRTSARSWPSRSSSPVSSAGSVTRWYGRTGRGDPPMPGRSNRITSRRGSSASTNGWRTSRLAPMPLHSSNGGHAGSPGRTSTRRTRPRTVSVLVVAVVISLSHDGRGSGRRPGWARSWWMPFRCRGPGGAAARGSRPCARGLDLVRPGRAGQLALEDLAGRGHGQGVTELHDPRVLVSRHVLLAPGDQFVLGQRRARDADHERLDLLAVAGVRHPDDRDQAHARVREQYLFQFPGIHVEPAADDHVL